MKFDSPLLLALAPLVGAAFFALAWLARSRKVERARAWAEDVARLARQGRWGSGLLTLAALASGVALAGPRGGRTEVKSESRALSIVFAVDISRSMLAEDVVPSRLKRTVREVRRLVQDLGGDRLGLIAFAGRSYILTPLTVDGGAIAIYLDALDPSLASLGGTSMGAVLKQGAELLGAPGSGEGADRVLVVFTDGEDHDSLAGTLAAAHTLGRTGVRLILVAEGQGNPARIPVRDSAGVLLQYQQETDGHVIETSRRDDVLQAIADAAEGTLVPAALPDQAGAVRDLVASFKRAPSQETTSADLLPKSWVPMLAALAALLVHTFTRRSAALVALAGLLVAPRLGAQVPSKGEAASAAGQPVEAAKAFLADAGAGVAADTAYYNAGTAALRAGQFDVARKALDKATHSIDPDLRYRALYNLGVTQLQAAARDSVHRATLLSEASQALQDALLIAPDSPRAKWNLELARRRRPPPPSSAGGGPPPPQPKGGESNSPTGQAPPVPSLSQNQAEQILNSVEREERDTRLKHSAHTRFATPPIKDW